MGGDKITIMVLKVDLQCCSGYKKVKKILRKFPEIRDQTYDEKGNRVTITVVCCNPEKLRDKLCCKGCGVIMSIEIKDPPKPEKSENGPKPTPDGPPGPPPEKPEKPPKHEPGAPPSASERVTVITVPIQVYPPPPSGYCCGRCNERPTGVPPPPSGCCCGRCNEHHTGVPPPPSGYCCGQCYEGSAGGPCYQWCGRRVPQPPCYDNYGPWL